MDTKRYFINGWEESKQYFMSLVKGNITRDQYKRLKSGEEITIGSNVFRIEQICR